MSRPTITEGQRRQVASALARMCAGDSGPSRSLVASIIAAAGLRPEKILESKEVLVRRAVQDVSDARFRELVAQLVDALVDEGAFASETDRAAGDAASLWSAVREIGAERTSSNRLKWHSPTEEASINGDISSGARASLTAQMSAAGRQERMVVNVVDAPTIFIVHGHAEALRNEVEVSLRRWIRGVEVIVLDRQPNAGDVLVEKFERHAATATYAIILATPDDEGRVATDPRLPLMRRPRQNVVFEMGYFFAKLGRGKVAVLDGGVERPSDIAGLVYIPMSGNWSTALARELRAAGVDGDWLQ